MPKKAIGQYKGKNNIEVSRQYRFDGGLNTNDNPNQIGDNQLTVAQNIRIGKRGELITRDGYDQIGATIGTSAAITGGGYYHVGDSVNKILVKYNTDLYTSTGGNFSALSTTLTAGANMEMVTAQDIAYITTGTDTFRKYNNTTVSTLANIPITSATSSDQPRVLEYWSERFTLFLANTVNFPQRLYYSDIDDLEVFRADQFIDFDGPITGLKAFHDRLFVWTSFSTFIVSDIRAAAGGNNDIAYELVTRRLPADVGCIAKRSPRVVNGYLYWVSEKGIYRSEGNYVDYISSDIENVFETEMTSKSQICGGSMGNLYYVGYTRTGQTVNDRVLVVDTLRTRPIVASIDTGYSPSVFIEYPTSGVFKLYYGDMTTNSGKVYKCEVSGAAEESVAMQIETKAYDFESIELIKRLRRTFFRLADSGDFDLSIGYKGTTDAGFTISNFNLLGNTAIRGSVTRGLFTRGYGGDLERWIITKLKSRTITYQFKYTGIDKIVTLYGLSPAFRKVTKLR